MKIIYIHGFNSSPFSDKVESIRKSFPESIVLANQHFSTVDSVLSNIDSIVQSMDIESDVLVGSSLGGFWANYFSEKYRIPAVLINPAVEPSKTLKKYIGQEMMDKRIWSNTDCEEYIAIEKKILHESGGPQRKVLLAKDDSVIPYQKTFSIYDPISSVELYESGGHSFSDSESLLKINNAISRISNSIVL